MVNKNIDAENSDNYSASIVGWTGFGQPATALGYAVDGGAIVWLEGGINANPEDAVKGLAGELAIRYGIQADLSGLEFGEHTVVYYVRLEDKNICEFYGQNVITNDPSYVGDSSYDFDTAVTPDVGSLFVFLAGLAPEECNYTAAPYKMAGINQLTLTADGTFKMTITGLKTDSGHAAVLFRGNPNPTFGDANYYGHDGNNDTANPDSLSVGCAGIYVGIEDVEGTPYLRLNVKGKNGDVAVPHVYKVAMTSNNLTVVDDNDTVKFYEGETLLATVDVNGMEKGYATEAIVTLADGTTETLTDVCCAATVASDIGFIARSTGLYFDGLTLNKLGTDPVEPSTTIDAEFKAADETGTTLAGSNLSSVFGFTQAAAGPSVIESGVYILKDFAEAIANPDGAYAFTTDIASVGNKKLSAMFVRGVYNFNFGDGGYYGAIFSNGINNGPNSNYSGSAGIYLSAANEGLGVTNLSIRFHCWDGSAVTIKEYMVPVNSTKITAVDRDGSVYILAGNELAAVITISGTKDFGYTGHPSATVDPEACAETVVIKTAEIEETVTNAVVAATCTSQIGLATRAGGGTISVSYVSLKPAATVTIPKEFAKVEPPVEYVNLALGKDTSLTTSVENDANIPANATDGDPATRWGAFPTGEASFVVDFAELTKIRFLQLDFENTVLPWTVYVSTDGTNWTEKYKGRSGGGRTEIVDFGELVELRYVKITRDTEPEGQGSNWFSIYEFIAFGETIEAPESVKKMSVEKTEFAVGEAINVTSSATGKDWIGIYEINDVFPNIGSIYWYYPADYAGQAVNIRGISQIGADQATLGRTDLPAGEYKIILFANDGYDVIEQINITINA